jgi:hypothetical protein
MDHCGSPVRSLDCFINEFLNLTLLFCAPSLSSVTGVSIPQKTAVIGMGGISFFALMYLLSGVFWWALFSSGILVSVHAFLRDASMHKDMDDQMAMEGDLHIGEESSFLGSNPV